MKTFAWNDWHRVTRMISVTEGKIVTNLINRAAKWKTSEYWLLKMTALIGHIRYRGHLGMLFDANRVLHLDRLFRRCVQRRGLCSVYIAICLCVCQTLLGVCVIYLTFCTTTTVMFSATLITKVLEHQRRGQTHQFRFDAPFVLGQDHWYRRLTFRTVATTFNITHMGKGGLGDLLQSCWKLS